MPKQHHEKFHIDSKWFKDIEDIVRSKATLAILLAQLSNLGNKALSIASHDYAFKPVMAVCTKLPFHNVALPILAIGWILHKSCKLMKAKKAAAGCDSALEKVRIPLNREWCLLHYDEDKKEITLADGYIIKCADHGVITILMQNFINAKKNGREVETIKPAQLAEISGINQESVYRRIYEIRTEIIEHLDSVGVDSNIDDFFKSNGRKGYQVNAQIELLLCRPCIKN
jgi:hypothetical protein